MSVLIEFIPNIFVALAFDFILYSTGAGLLRLVTLGRSQYQAHSYAEFKNVKSQSSKGLIIPYVIGVLFYTLLILLVAWLN